MTLTEVSDEAFKSYRAALELIEAETQRLSELGIVANIQVQVGVTDYPGAPHKGTGLFDSLPHDRGSRAMTPIIAPTVTECRYMTLCLPCGYVDYHVTPRNFTMWCKKCGDPDVKQYDRMTDTPLHAEDSPA